MWQYADFMSNKTVHCTGWMATLICFKAVILNLVQVMNWFSGFKFMIKWLSPFFLWIKKGYVKIPIFPRSASMVSSDSIDLIYESIMLSWVFGTFTSHLLLEGLLVELQQMPLYCTQHKGVLGYDHQFMCKLPQSPSHGNWAPAFHAWKQPLWVPIWSWKAVVWQLLHANRAVC